MEDPQIKEKLVNGKLDFEKHLYRWNANLPIPKESIYFRFQYKRTQQDQHPELFTPYYSTKDNFGNFLSVVMTKNEEHYLRCNIYTNYKSHIIRNKYQVEYIEYDSFDNMNKFSQIGLRLTPYYIYLYIDDELVVTQYKTGAASWPVTLKQFTEVDYKINDKIGNIGQMKNIQVYHDLNEEQFECLKQSQEMVTCESEQLVNGICQDDNQKDYNENRQNLRQSTSSQTNPQNTLLTTILEYLFK